MRPPGVLSGIKWFAKPPQTTCSDGAGLSIQDLTETGGLAVRFQHPSSALECFLIAARRADAPARALVGIMYRDGIGTAVNYREAVDWLKKSAVQDEYNGQLALAQMYEVGMGVRADPEQGRYWRQRAQQNPAYLQQLKNEAQAEKNQERAERREQHTQDMMFMGMAAVLTGVVAAF
jgi:TPR repeat protein